MAHLIPLQSSEPMHIYFEIQLFIPFKLRLSYTTSYYTIKTSKPQVILFKNFWFLKKYIHLCKIHDVVILCKCCFFEKNSNLHMLTIKISPEISALKSLKFLCNNPIFLYFVVVFRILRVILLLKLTRRQLEKSKQLNPSPANARMQMILF